MPRYEFRCSLCGNTIEQTYLSFDDATKARVRCDGCDHRMERRISAPAFVVTGFNAKNLYSGGK